MYRKIMILRERVKGGEGGESNNDNIHGHHHHLQHDKDHNDRRHLAAAKALSVWVGKVERKNHHRSS